MSPISAPAEPAALAFENFLAVLTIIFPVDGSVTAGRQ
jgi:hypothetical protein